MIICFKFSLLVMLIAIFTPAIVIQWIKKSRLVVKVFAIAFILSFWIIQQVSIAYQVSATDIVINNYTSTVVALLHKSLNLNFSYL